MLLARCKAGYREGIGAGRNSTMQAGFDEGYRQAAPIGREVGRLRGIAASLLVHLTSGNASQQADKAQSNTSTSSNSSQTYANDIELARDMVRRLGKLKLQDIAGRDEEAEKHALEHGEEVHLPVAVQDKREMERLEDSMSALGNPQCPRQSADGKEQLKDCRVVLQQLLERAGLATLQP